MTRQALLGFLLLGFTCGILGSCADSPIGIDPFEARAIPEELLPYVDAVVEANTRFALDFYARLQGENGNLFFSPWSISTVLSMVLAGAADGTMFEMEEVMHVPSGFDRWHEMFGALHASLDRGSELGGYELSTVNGMWIQQDFPLLESYLDITGEHYDAAQELVDFCTDFENVRARINQWVADQTGDRINELFKPDMINQETLLALANAVYFKGTWQFTFDENHTQDATFWVRGVEPVEVPMMKHEEVSVEFGAFEDFSAVALPYDGEDVEMMILVPQELDGLAELEALLSFENIRQWRGALQEAEILVALPRFEFTFEASLKDQLAAMGMPSAFDPYSADFSGITGGRDLYLEVLVHNAYVRVDEEGTEAAAATGAGFGPTSAGEGVVADHPFIFIIWDNVTESILFMGRVVDPR